MSKILSRDDILAVDDLKPRRVRVAEWGGDVFVRAMSGAERLAYERELDERRASGGEQLQVILLFLQKVICDEAGAPLFSLEDMESLERKNWAVLYDIFETAGEINALDEKDVEELEGNSEAAPGSASPTTSPGNSAA